MKRRNFTTGAVLMTLANRPAWAQQTECLSANTFASIAAGSSLHPGQRDLPPCEEPNIQEGLEQWKELI